VIARIAAIGALLAGAALALALLLGGDDGHSYALRFQTGGQLVPGNEVLVGGQPVGTVDEIVLTDDAEAEVRITVDEPLHEGTTGLVRATSLSGIANRYVSLAPGANSEPELPDGATIPSDRTTAPVDLDQLFDTLNARTRRGLQDVIQGEAAVYSDHLGAARKTYKFFAPSLQETEQLLAEVNRDDAALRQFLASGARVFGAVAERRDDLAALTSNANAALGAIASENEAFDRSLAALPPALRQADTTFVNLRPALDDLDPLVADTKRVAPLLAPFLRQLRPVARKAVPVVRDLRLTVARDGKANDLTDALRDLPRAQKRADSAVPATIAGLDASQHLIEFARPYSPDLLALIGKLGTEAGYYDADGHFLRAQPAGANLFDWDEVTGELMPIPPSQQFDAYSALGLGPFTRCPGGATQANVGWPTPTDHPFLDDGALTGECDPNDVPPGP
jgi:phospholipid/cholesterol/gamma-HCH transport system substrate-binding protein